MFDDKWRPGLMIQKNPNVIPQINPVEIILLAPDSKLKSNDDNANENGSNKRAKNIVVVVPSSITFRACLKASYDHVWTSWIITTELEYSKLPFSKFAVMMRVDAR